MEFKGTKTIITMPCGATSGTNQDRPSNIVFSNGKVLAKFYGETPEEATANALIFTQALNMLETLAKNSKNLKYIYDNFEDILPYNGTFVKMINEADALIKKATEL